ncbi:ALWAYS EARLY 3-like protein isoform X4, partial [Tanacetum coccineum]
VTAALLNLRQRNTHPSNPLPPYPKIQSSSSGIAGPISSVDNFSLNNQLPSNVVELVNNSRFEAHKLVHTAFQAMSKIKVEQNVRSTVAAVLSSLGVGKNPTEYGSSTIRPSEQFNGGAFKHKLNSTPDPLANNHASDSKLQHNETETTIPFELIVSCVATYHVIQMCTERQYPPSDVVQMLDSAFAKLHPLCPQNLPIFREIQMCMARVKTQILALVPS